MRKIVTFAAVYIGTYEVTLRIYEIKNEAGKLREIDYLRMPTDLARDIFEKGKVTYETLDRLCECLSEMMNTAGVYKVDDYRICAGYAIRSAENVYFVLDQIRIRCGLDVEIISNSEQRFLTYLASAAIDKFEDMIADTAIMVDVGGSSLQITLFDDGKLITTQHIYIGGLRIRENLNRLYRKNDVRDQLKELINKELMSFIRMYLGDRQPKYLILLNDQILNILRRINKKAGNHLVDKAEGMKSLKKIYSKLTNAVSSDSDDIIEDPDEMLLPFYLIFETLATDLPYEQVFMPGVSITDGIALEYAYNNKLLRSKHDFEEDVLGAAWSIAERYDCYKPHLNAMEKLSAEIFDVTKKYHGMKKRERLMIRTAAILHDCGKYISLSRAPEASHTIIMSTEILGLTHKEREIIASVCAYIHRDVPPYSEMADHFDESEYLIFLKLLAILRVANAMDRSNKQKIKNVKMVIRERSLVITIESKDSITLETGLFEEKAEFFESVFAIRPVLREKKL
ncbi:MAG: phosphatase [Lachnospiraceae bacterium]|nr:phosphatase [Lachnospiraceae bacterium]